MKFEEIRVGDVVNHKSRHGLQTGQVIRKIEYISYYSWNNKNISNRSVSLNLQTPKNWSSRIAIRNFDNLVLIGHKDEYIKWRETNDFRTKETIHP